MAIELNHTIVPARDKKESVRFYADIFGFTYEDWHTVAAPVPRRTWT